MITLPFPKINDIIKTDKGSEFFIYNIYENKKKGYILYELDSFDIKTGEICASDICYPSVDHIAKISDLDKEGHWCRNFNIPIYYGKLEISII